MEFFILTLVSVAACIFVIKDLLDEQDLLVFRENELVLRSKLLNSIEDREHRKFLRKLRRTEKRRAYLHNRWFKH